MSLKGLLYFAVVVGVFALVMSLFATTNMGVAGANGEDGLDFNATVPYVFLYNGTSGMAFNSSEPYVFLFNGTDGDDGLDGATWLTGSGAPSAGLGVNGDLYLRTDTYDVYLKSGGSWSIICNIKGVQGDKGDTGDAGADGVDGSTWFNGSGAPSAGLGVNGDYYLRTDTYDVYYKSGGSWSVLMNIKGATGSTGATGASGMGGLTVLMADWDVSVTKTNIGASFVDIYTASTMYHLANFTGFTQFRVMYCVNKVGTGTQSWQLVFSNGTAFGTVNDAGGTGVKTLDTGWVANGNSGELSFRPQGKSTTAGDDPVWYNAELLFK